MGNAGTAIQLSMLEHDVLERGHCRAGNFSGRVADLGLCPARETGQTEVEETESRVVESEQLEAEMDKMERQYEGRIYRNGDRESYERTSRRH